MRIQFQFAAIEETHQATLEKIVMKTALFEDKLRGVYSLRAAAPVLNECLASINIGEENPAFILDWQENNVLAFVAAANCFDADQAPSWLRTQPPAMTTSSFVDDVITVLQREAEGHCGHVMLASDDLRQFLRLSVTLVGLQNDTFLQDAMEAAHPSTDGVKRYLAVTYHLTEPRVHRVQPNDLPPVLQRGISLRRLFS